MNRAAKLIAGAAIAAVLLAGCASNSGGATGGSAQPEAPAPGPVAKTGERGGSAQTPQERRAEVDGKLDASLGAFDEQLKREQQRTAQERDARSGGRGGSGGSGESGTGGAADGLDGGPGAAGGRSGRDRAGDLRSESRTGESGGGGAVSGRVIPDGSDDDIIARRLRKAAEAETDPELKEKLWKEYVDYKSNARSGR